tara:strand:+ start:443 stop:1162 length:720 start_codon:yes stop_codon:yes gene_type:complete
LYKDKYLVNNKYPHPKHRLQSLTKFYNYLQLHHYRYSVLNVTLSYTDDTNHDPRNITKLLKHLREAVVINGERLPIHHVWKLEHRASAKTNNQATGYHYHLFLIWNQDVEWRSNKVEDKLKKKWEKLGGIVNKNSFYTSHKKIKSVYDSKQMVMRTETDKRSGLFHHLTYLTKEDPLQALPDNYIGEEFQTSQRNASRLTAHRDIKTHNLTIKAENQVVPTVTTPEPELIVFDEDELPF